MNKSLGIFDANRLSELVSIYLNPPGEFTLYKNGEVSVNKAVWWRRKLNIRDDSTMDFLSVAQEVADKMMNAKQNLPLVQVLCSEAIGTLIDTNDRQEVIKKLYLAHLVDEQFAQKFIFKNGNQQQGKNNRQLPTVDIQVIEERRNRPQSVRVFNNRDMNTYRSQQIADALNGAEMVIIHE